MDGTNGQQPERLEDQLRRMIVGGQPGQPAAPKLSQLDTDHSTTGGIPPNGYHAQQQMGRPFPTQQYGPRQGQRGPNPQYQPNFAGPDPNVQPRGQPNGRRGNGQQRGNFGHQNRPQHFDNQRPPPYGATAPHQRARYQQQMPLDPNAFQRSNFGPPNMRQSSGQQQLFNPNQPQGPPVNYQADSYTRQVQYLDQIGATEVRNVEMSQAERDDKESFRIALQTICNEVCEANADRIPKVDLECFGSFQSGFATAGSDMDLVIVVKDSNLSAATFSLLEDDLPRTLEKRVLQLGYGARLLTRTRVPIIKVCEKPDASFLDKLREEREKWDVLPNEKKYPHLHPEVEDADVEEHEQPAVVLENGQKVSVNDRSHSIAPFNTGVISFIPPPGVDPHIISLAPAPSIAPTGNSIDSANGRAPKQRRDEPWTRERKAGPLDFPKTGVGIQSDINFFNPLGLHNTQMLRCYSLCDPRVRSMILFVKAWVKRRKINSSYSGTLSSYGYVLMVLHYLVNIAQPAVLPNLQAAWRPRGNYTQAGSNANMVDGWHVDFWRNEDEITAAAQQGQLTSNREPLGSLLAGFFHYYSSQGGGVTFRWMQEVLSLRTVGGLNWKEAKGWVKAVTEEGEGKKVQHRYLFCIEDPFELDHNVARTVTHKGIVAIRDEFRRARRILRAVGNGVRPIDGELFSNLVEAEDFQKAAEQLKSNGTRNGAVDSMTGTPTMKSTPKVTQVEKNSNARAANQQVHATNRQPHTRLPPKKTATSTPPSKMNVLDTESFPALSSSKGAKKQSPHARQPSDTFSEISGDKAQAYLVEVKRKRDEAQAESTAMGAAEAVLGDSD